MHKTTTVPGLFRLALYGLAYRASAGGEQIEAVVIFFSSVQCSDNWNILPSVSYIKQL
jgi:hypothetical protein